MFDRYDVGEHAILVHIDFADEAAREDLEELKLLVSSAAVEVRGTVTARRNAPHPKYFIGGGKAEEIADLVRATAANLVIFNHALSPAQERNLERLCECRVVDRTGLILDIFAQRARTHEGKLQVELAQLKHLSTRLVRGWTHLERQKGGIGLRGPGETQLETDRRLLRGRIQSILRRLDKVDKQRDQGRRARRRVDMPTLSLVGYTNAGKSTLFNRMTNADVYAADQLFATLDPTLRKIELGEVGPAVLADTVGFIRHLPHDLVAAFKATLKETQEADLLLHVVDASDPRLIDNMHEVGGVLDEIDAGDVPVLVVYNKIDCLEQMTARIEQDQEGVPRAVWLSARSGEGIDLLLEAIAERVGRTMLNHTLLLPPNMGRFRGVLYGLNCVQHEEYTDEGGWRMTVRIPATDWERVIKQESLDSRQIICNPH